MSKKRPVSPNAEQPTSSNRPKTTVKLRYLFDGEAGVVEIDSGQKYVSIDALLTGIKREHLTPEQKREDCESKRKAADYSIKRINGCDAFVATGTSVVMSNELSLLKNKAKKIDHIKTNLFHKNRKQCNFKEESKRCLAKLAQTNVGGSNQATCVLFAATLHVILNIEMRLVLTDE